MQILIRTFLKEDIPFALAQTDREGWDCNAAFYETLLAHDPEGMFIATVNDTRAGLITTTKYERSAWIGNLIVLPEFRKHSIGSELMNHVIQHLESGNIRTIRLEADPLGINIYHRCGFQDEFDSPRFRIEDYKFEFPSNVEKLEKNELSEIAAIDAEAFGDLRISLLHLLFSNVAAAYKIKKSETIAGYIVIQHSAAGYRLGPWIAKDKDTACDLLAAALNRTDSKPVILAIPGANSAGTKLLSESGFRQTPSSLRMVRGVVSATGIPEHVYGLASGAIG